MPANPGSNPLFKFEGQSVRVVMIEDKPWFVMKDVAECLGFDAEGTGNYHTSLDGRDKLVIEKRVANSDLLPMFHGRTPVLTLVSEPGLYKLILRAQPNRHPAAKRFQDWVTREVLPALRKDGMYVMGEEKVKAGEMSHHLPRKPAGYEVIFTRQ